MGYLTAAKITTTLVKNLPGGKSNIPAIILNYNNVEESMIVPLSFNKPKISKEKSAEYMTIGDIENKIILNLSTKRKSDIFFRENQNKIFQTNPELAEMLMRYRM